MNMKTIFFLLFSSSCFAGILAASRGGTGYNNVPILGGAVYSTASGFTTTAAPTANNQILSGNSLAAPVWVTSLVLPNGGTVYIPAGGTTAGTQPLTIVAGSTLTTPINGAIESNGTNLYWTNSSGTRYKFNLTVQ